VHRLGRLPFQVNDLPGREAAQDRGLRECILHFGRKVDKMPHAGKYLPESGLG
jgi:hypothetical protein